MGSDHSWVLLRVLFLVAHDHFSLYPSVQFSSVTQSCPTLCNPMNRSTPGLPVHHHLLEFAQTHAHQVSDAIQPSHPLSSPSVSLHSINRRRTGVLWSLFVRALIPFRKHPPSYNLVTSQRPHLLIPSHPILGFSFGGTHSVPRKDNQIFTCL